MRVHLTLRSILRCLISIQFFVFFPAQFQTLEELQVKFPEANIDALRSIEIKKDSGGKAHFSISSVDIGVVPSETFGSSLCPTQMSSIYSFLRACFYLNPESAEHFPRSSQEMLSLFNFFCFAFKYLDANQSATITGTQMRQEGVYFLANLQQVGRFNWQAPEFASRISLLAGRPRYEIISCVKRYCDFFRLNDQVSRALGQRISVVIGSLEHFKKGAGQQACIAEQSSSILNLFDQNRLEAFFNGGIPIFCVLAIDGLVPKGGVSKPAREIDRKYLFLRHTILLGLAVENHFGKKGLQVAVYYPFKGISPELVKAKIFSVIFDLFSRRKPKLVRSSSLQGFKPIFYSAQVEEAINPSDLQALVDPVVPAPVATDWKKRFFAFALLAAILKRARDKFARARASKAESAIEAPKKDREKSQHPHSVDDRPAEAQKPSIESWAAGEHLVERLSDYEDRSSVVPEIAPKNRQSIVQKIIKALAARPEGMPLEKALAEACKKAGIKDSSYEGLVKALGQEFADKVEDAIEVVEAGGVPVVDQSSPEGSPSEPGATKNDQEKPEVGAGPVDEQKVPAGEKPVAPEKVDLPTQEPEKPLDKTKSVKPAPKFSLIDLPEDDQQVQTEDRPAVEKPARPAVENPLVQENPGVLSRIASGGKNIIGKGAGLIKNLGMGVARRMYGIKD